MREKKKEVPPDYQTIMQLRGPDRVKQIEKDLELIVKTAKKEFKAKDAKAIPASSVVIERRVQWKCRFPQCFAYNSSPLCPPNTPDVDEVKEVVKSYEYAVLVCIDYKIKDATGLEFFAKSAKMVEKLNKVVGQTEAFAQRLGYYLAMGFKGGPCTGCGMWTPKWQGYALSSDKKEEKKAITCNVLNSMKSGGLAVCKNYYLKARPAAEAMGIDVFETAAKAGWPMYFIGDSGTGEFFNEETIPVCAKAKWVGLVLIG